MRDDRALNVTSEIGRLKTVLLHRPGEEIENLTPDLLDRLLFDDIPYLKVAREEHDAFAQTLREAGVEVLYLEVLAAEAIGTNDEVKQQFISEFIDEAGVESERLKEALIQYFNSFSDNKAMVDKMMAGVRKEELKDYHRESLYDQVNNVYPFVCDPMPNLYFTRDPFATIGHGITLNHMRTDTRNRETIFAKYIFRHHPRFEGKDIPFWFNRDEKTSLEGGDELILSKEILAVGISQRTDSKSVEKLAKKLLYYPDTSFKTVLAFKIPVSRAFMHLDTVFTQVDYDKFTVHPGIVGPLEVYAITKDPENDGQLIAVEECDTLENILKKYLKRDIELIKCGGGDEIIAAREQWNDGSNTLAIAPGEVVVYSRNYVTNEILEKKGIKLHVIPSSELSRGRGGPRCMSMPLIREDL
ncbi:TPA: arginine deiminase [Clostridium perfringens]|uniref:Arginine deiminase n=1 Tax=Clostridium perfringens TaxID=1502 RepID=A0A127EEL2_CLOPF|nr:MULTISPECIES: arginine deiminase [Clostridium]AMN34392.1 arginine deiminase [Clostridium perfringens]EGT4137431.1 arginine deiminase [Clostridium perfringens]ELC8425918.1 arginine deiminase [Clostridium perfringens]MDK7590864.1 arginine deiminase [Clostridium sp. UMB9555B]MDK7629186.1 arginine deiminase [Clostridium sp. UMB9555A]